MRAARFVLPLSLVAYAACSSSGDATDGGGNAVVVPGEAGASGAPSGGGGTAGSSVGGAGGHAGAPGGNATAGFPSGGSPGAGAPNGGNPNAGSPNAGSPDAGGPNAGAPSAGAPSAGASGASGNGGSGGAGTTCPTAAFDTGSPRGGDTPSYVNASTYDYSPSVMLDGVYRMWWCCGLGGDHVCYAEADSLDGPWHAHGKTTPNGYDDVFGPTGSSSDFDGTHTCDPSVVRVDGTYYMYYGGLAENTSTSWTRVGVATSDDGLAWKRLNSGKPIFDAARNPFTSMLPNAYGAGQPSVTFVDGKFWLVYTDTTGLDSNKVNGGGVYVVRSPDPTFQTDVEELGAQGFAPWDPATHTSHKLADAYGADWQYVDAVDAFVVAISSSSGTVGMRVFDKGLASQIGTFSVPGAWTEEPALASRPDKHAIPSTTCGVVPIDVMRSVGKPGMPPTWDLAHAGVDLLTGLSCDCVPQARVFEGTLLGVPGLPLALIHDGVRLQFALAAPAHDVARTTVNPGAAVYQSIPYGASMHQGDPVLGATGRPGAFHLDDGKLWPVSCPEIVTDDGSSITTIDVATWDAYPKGPALHCAK